MEIPLVQHKWVILKINSNILTPKWGVQKISILEKINNESLPPDEKNYEDYIKENDSVPSKYINGMWNGTRWYTNGTFTEQLMIGNSESKIDGPHLIIRNKSYWVTRDLYDYCSSKALKTLRKMLKNMNKHTRYNKPNKQIEGGKIKKYNNIIALMGNLSLISGERILLEYLLILFSSISAEHTNHINDINSINSVVWKLREANINYLLNEKKSKYKQILKNNLLMKFTTQQELI